MKYPRLLIAMALCLPGVRAADARITRFEITSVESPAFGGYRWPGVGRYEKIVGIAHGEVDPQDARNAVIADIDLAPTNARGRVEYSFDFYILKPVDLHKGAHKVFYEPPNRGHKTWSLFARVPAGDDPGASLTDPAVLARAFFLARGYTVVWSGWDPAAGRQGGGLALTISLPTAVHRNGSPITGPAEEYIVGAERSHALAYPAATRNKSWAHLTHRLHPDDPAEELPADAWDYDADGTSISLAGGPFMAGNIYEFSYTATQPTVNGLGLAAVRDFNAWLRYAEADDAGHRNPLAHDVRRIETGAYSQAARMLNDFRYLGFNQAENGARVFDGMLQWGAAGNGLNLDSRFSQPGRPERSRQDHRHAEGAFPFANVPTTDPVTGRIDSRLARCQATSTCPVSVEILTTKDYRGAAGSLLHTTPDGRHDLPYSRYTRDYLISGTPSGSVDPAAPGLCRQVPYPLEAAAVEARPVEVAPVARALFLALDAWTQGTAPPPSRVPRIADGTLVIPQPPYRDNPRRSPIYPSLVPATDRDGNDLAGVRVADVAVPLTTTAAGDLRAGPQAEDGCDAADWRIPLAKTRAERLAAGDPRPSIEERYPNGNIYRRALVQTLDDLVRDRLLLCEDVDSEFARLSEAGIAGGVPPGTAAPSAGHPPAPQLPHCRS